MVTNGIITGKVMPGGWAYPQLLRDGTSIKIRSSSYKRLEEEVFNFRLGNIESIQSGTCTLDSVRKDIHDYICEKYPSNCADRNHKAVMVHQAGNKIDYKSPIRRVEDWFSGIGSNSINHVDAVTAFKRASICSTCPQNIHWENACGPCVGNINRRSLRLNGSRSTSYDDKLHACRCFGFLIKSAVWINDPGKESEQNIPSECWNN